MSVNGVDLHRLYPNSFTFITACIRVTTTTTTSHMSTAVEEDIFFQSMGGKCFSTFDEFQELLDAYQKESSSCFVVVASYSAEQSNKIRGTNIPTAARYYRATYRCVHGVAREVNKHKIARKHRQVK